MGYTLECIGEFPDFQSLSFLVPILVVVQWVSSFLCFFLSVFSEMKDGVSASNATSSSSRPPPVSAAVLFPAGLSQDDITHITTTVADLICPPFLAGP